jgi:hypothetical protein
MDTLDLLVYLVFLILIAGMGIFFKMYPKFPALEKRQIEPFASPAVAPFQPKCTQRNADAQVLLRLFPPCPDESKAPTEDATDRAELSLILNKLTCLDADVNSNGVKGYNTMSLQYNTSHDQEPLGSFVGRCLNNGIRQRDIELLAEKYEKRGKTLITQIATRQGIDGKSALETYETVIKTTIKSLTTHCLAQRSSLDTPYGPRDPGYAIPYSVSALAPF